MKLLDKVLEKFGIVWFEERNSFEKCLKESSGAKELREQLELIKELEKKATPTPQNIPFQNIERKVGEKFDYKGITLEVVEDTLTNTCGNCFFKDLDCRLDHAKLGACSSEGRLNKKSVSFIPVAEGNKFDTGKLSYTLLPFKAITEVVKVLMFGEQKYGRDNWQKVTNARQRYLDASFRHCISYCEGETYDPESSRHHLAHVVCCLLFVIWFDLTSNKEENQ